MALPLTLGPVDRARLLRLSMTLVAGLLGACQPDGSDSALDDWPPTGSAAGDASYYGGADGSTPFPLEAGIIPVVIVGSDGGAGTIVDGAVDVDAHAPDAQLPMSAEAGASSDSGDGVDASQTDDAATPVDASVFDAGPFDAGPPDAGVRDAGPPDAGVKDAGPPDAGPPDAGVKDAGAATIKSCTVTATTVAPTAGSYAPAYGSALWINNSAGKLVKKFVVYGNGSHTSLPQYNTSASGVAGVDSVTSATLKSTKSYSFTWDLKSPSGALVADGNYTFQIETRAGVGDRLAKVPFAKSATPVNASVADGNGVTGAKVSCQ